MADPIASFVIPVFNGEAFLGQALDSALQQTRRDIEVIVVDDGSDDATPAILGQYESGDARLRVYRQDHSNGNYVSALNRALSLARGKYVCRLDADDIATPHRVEHQIDFLEANEDHAMVGGRIEVISEGGSPVGFMDCPTDHETIVKVLRSYNCFTHSAVTMRRECCESGYDSYFLMVEDYDLWIRLASRYKVANLPEVVCRYRIHPNQVSASRLRRQLVAWIVIKACARGVPVEKVKSMWSDLGDVEFPELRALGLTAPEIGNEIVSAYGFWAARFQSIGRADYAADLLAEAVAQTTRTAPAPHLLNSLLKRKAQAEIAAGRYSKAMRSLGEATLSSALIMPSRVARRLKRMAVHFAGRPGEPE